MTGSAGATEPDLLEDFAPLIRHLRNHRFQLSIVDELRVFTLHEELRLRGIRISDRTDLAWVIAPVVCRSPDEQERLPEILGRWKIVGEGRATDVGMPIFNSQPWRGAPTGQFPQIPQVQPAVLAQVPRTPPSAPGGYSLQGGTSNERVPLGRRRFLPWLTGAGALVLLLIIYLLRDSLG